MFGHDACLQQTPLLKDNLKFLKIPDSVCFIVYLLVGSAQRSRMAVKYVVARQPWSKDTVFGHGALMTL